MRLGHCDSRHLICAMSVLFCTLNCRRQKKSPQAVAAGANQKPVTYLVMPGQVAEVKGVCDPRPGKTGS